MSKVCVIPQENNMADVKTPEKIQREKRMLNDLEKLLKGDWENAGLKILPDNYFFIEDILGLPGFNTFTWGEFREATHSDGLLRFSVRGSKIRLKPPELNKDPDVILSKKLAWILRHGAEKEGFQFEDGGHLYLEDMMNMNQFRGYTISDFQRVVDNNDKKRFEIREHPQSSRLQIRATQGHSIKVEGLDLRLIDDPYQYPTVVHGTYFKCWGPIQKGGLQRMGRTHIHMAPGEVGQESVISGMRASAEILIYIDVAMAMKDGIQFHISTNNVILSEGDQNGTIATRYFKSVYQRRPRTELKFQRW